MPQPKQITQFTQLIDSAACPCLLRLGRNNVELGIGGAHQAQLGAPQDGALGPRLAVRVQVAGAALVVGLGDVGDLRERGGW